MNSSLSLYSIMAEESSHLGSVRHRYDRCLTCSKSLFLVYEDSPGYLKLGDWNAGTSNAVWRWSGLPANPIPETGLAMRLSRKPNVAASIIINYQSQDMRLCSMDCDVMLSTRQKVRRSNAFKVNYRLITSNHSQAARTIARRFQLLRRWRPQD